MANTKVTSGVIKDDAVGADQLASNSVVTASIVDNAITTAKINNDAILTAKISNSAVTNAKLASNSVDSDQYVDGSIDTAHIADGQITSAKLDTNISIGGTLTLGSHLIMGDNDRIKIGTGTDLEIYHDGSDTFIDDSSGTGNLYVLSNQFLVNNADGTQNMGRFADGGAVTLYYAGDAKIATTSSGIDVTGTATMDGLTVDGDAVISSANARLRLKETDTTDNDTQLQTTGGVFKIARLDDDNSTATQRLTIDNSTGDISFYEDTGTTAKLFWDASAESLGIGTSSPSAPLHVAGNIQTDNFYRGYDSVSGNYRNLLGYDSGNVKIQTGTSSTTYGVSVFTAGTERLHVDGFGRVLIGQDSGDAFNADAMLRLQKAGDRVFIQLKTDADQNSAILFGDVDDDVECAIEYEPANKALTFSTGDNDEAMRIDSSGAVGVGQVPELARFSGHDILQVGGRATFLGNDTVSATGQTVLLDNLYYDASGNFQHRGDSRGVAMQFVEGKVIFSNSNQTTGTPTVTERMRIDNDGIMLLGTDTRAIGTAGNVNKFGVAGGSNSIFPMVVFADQDTSVEGGSVILELSYDADTSYSSANYVLFTDNTSTQGSISGTGNQTVSFNTSSDRRLKENIVNTESQLEKIKQIEVRDFNYIGNDITTTGMIAQELNEIIPNVVVEGLEDFKKHPWSIDYGKLTPYLIKAIQEQQEQIEELKKEIETFKN